MWVLGELARSCLGHGAGVVVRSSWHKAGHSALISLGSGHQGRTASAARSPESTLCLQFLGHTRARENQVAAGEGENDSPPNSSSPFLLSVQEQAASPSPEIHILKKRGRKRKVRLAVAPGYPWGESGGQW